MKEAGLQKIKGWGQNALFGSEPTCGVVPVLKTEPY